jgi:hypothetical protein
MKKEGKISNMLQEAGVLSKLVGKIERLMSEQGANFASPKKGDSLLESSMSSINSNHLNSSVGKSINREFNKKIFAINSDRKVYG